MSRPPAVRAARGPICLDPTQLKVLSEKAQRFRQPFRQSLLDGYNRLYDARIGGGFEFPPPPKPCPLEVCQGTPKGAPEEQAPGTGTYVGPGNALPQPTARKHKKQGAAKKKHKKKRQHKKSKQKQRAGHNGRNAR